MKTALIIVDVQNDFLAGGSLAVPHGEEVIPAINHTMMEGGFDLVVATQDWHPSGHESFSKWPVHCVKLTKGAELSDRLLVELVDTRIVKGFSRSGDGYSGFEGETGTGETLRVVLASRGVTDVYICGLATDYCVKATALDAVKNGFRTFVIEDAVRGVANETTRAAVDEMHAAGVTFVNSKDL